MPLLKTPKRSSRRRESGDHAHAAPRRRPAPRPSGQPPLVSVEETVVYPGGHVALERLSLAIGRRAIRPQRISSSPKRFGIHSSP